MTITNLDKIDMNPSARLQKKMQRPRVRKLKPKDRRPDNQSRNMKVDREELYMFLWRKADDRNCVRIHQGNLAEMLGVSAVLISKIIRGWMTEGRMVRVKVEKNGPTYYQLVEPSKVGEEKADGKVKTARTVQWG